MCHFYEVRACVCVCESAFVCHLLERLIRLHHELLVYVWGCVCVRESACARVCHLLQHFTCLHHALTLCVRVRECT
jgi:hypothetical protein